MDKQQNVTIELAAELARIGGTPVDWRSTPIEITAMARATDPVRIRQRDDWWKRAEPRDPVTGEKLIRLTDGRTLRVRDGQEEEQRSIHHLKGETGTTAGEIAERQRDREKVAVHDAEEYEKYLPGPGDNAHQWYAELAKRVDVNGADRRIWFNALGSYIGKFTPETKASELDENVVRTMLKMICED